MKALLKTGCGCTRLIDMNDTMPTIEVPLVNVSNFMVTGESDPMEKVFKTRRFRLMGNYSIPWLGDTLVYQEIE